MAEYLEREYILNAIRKNSDLYVDQQGLYLSCELIAAMPAADVQPVKTSKWCPPLMGQGKCDTYCERCYGKIMRNSTGIFEETPFCPHCGARMDGEQND